jgi:hypothetical protein
VALARAVPAAHVDVNTADEGGTERGSARLAPASSSGHSKATGRVGPCVEAARDVALARRRADIAAEGAGHACVGRAQHRAGLVAVAARHRVVAIASDGIAGRAASPARTAGRLAPPASASSRAANVRRRIGIAALALGNAAPLTRPGLFAGHGGGARVSDAARVARIERVAHRSERRARLGRGGTRRAG